jgi:SNF2 family DNA or RNA helicase
LSEKIIDTSRSDSAKIRKVIELVDEIEERSDQTEKIIIFSQFTSMLALVRQVLEDRNIDYVQCESSLPLFPPKIIDLLLPDDGTLNQNRRQNVINTIKEDPKIRVILMSFKAGGVGECPLITFFSLKRVDDLFLLCRLESHRL